MASSVVETWSPYVDYKVGNIVSYSGATYKAILASYAQTPPNATYWIVFSLSGGWVGTATSDLNMMGSYGISNATNVGVKGTVSSGLPGSYAKAVTGAPTSNWSGVASGLSAFGYANPGMGCVNGGFLYTINSAGVATARTAVNRNWTAMTNANANTTYVCENGGQIWSTSDGVTWTVLSASPTAAYTCLVNKPNSQSNLIAGTSTGALYFTTDSGATWTTMTPLASAVTSVCMASATLFYATTGGATGQIWKTTNAGVSWTAASATQRDWTCIVTTDGTLVWACSSTDPVYYSANSGSTWANISVTASIMSTSYPFQSSSIGTSFWLFAAKNGGYTYASSDGGVTWTQTSFTPGSWTCMDSSWIQLNIVSYGGGFNVIYGASASTPYLSLATDNALNLTSSGDIVLTPGYNQAGLLLNGKVFVQGAGTSNYARLPIQQFGTYTGPSTATGSSNITFPSATYAAATSYSVSVTPQTLGALVAVSNVSGTTFNLSWMNGSTLASNVFYWTSAGNGPT